ncbi:MAG: SelB C-terminal domain-containing protein, partial [Acidimicrobiia bacterium]|nr:SelB C-terminal domain-containing protein [Acidimicrobiia bacterium]
KLPKQFTVGDVKEELGLSRKYVVPILEWLDANLITVRKGEKRSLRGVGGSD